MDWLDLLAVQGTLKSLLQHHSSKASVLRCSAFFIVQLSHPHMTTGKTKALTRWTFVGKGLLFNMLSRFVLAMQGTWVQFLGREDPWGRKWQPTCVLAWRIPWTEEPGGLLSVGSQESDTTVTKPPQ